METTIFLLVSRTRYLEEVFEALDKLQCETSSTALFVLVNGEADVYIKARNLCEESKFGERLCIQEKPKKKIRQYDIAGRRRRISKMHNIAKEHIHTEYIFGVEDDTIVPPHALQVLQEQLIDGVGMVEGVEMGRWGVPYIGAWIADDIHNPTQIASLGKLNGTVDIDAGGFYCFVTKSEYYKNHEFKPFDYDALGPDADYSIALRRQGLKVLADFDVECIHKSENGDIIFGIAQPKKILMQIKGKQWRQSILQ